MTKDKQREIKFRGFGTWADCRRWVYGDLLHYTDGTVEIVEEKTQIRSFNYTVDPESVGEFTGLLDKNGKEIYEGDILKSTYRSGEVKFGECYINYQEYSAYGFYTNDEYQEIIIEGGRFEIIGNIYENPELLNQEK
jgi:uncharacterized phage protein (TIGR01671 family)